MPSIIHNQFSLWDYANLWWITRLSTNDLYATCHYSRIDQPVGLKFPDIVLAIAQQELGEPMDDLGNKIGPETSFQGYANCSWNMVYC